MESFHARHLDLFDPAILEAKRSLILGAGSVGSMAAMMLVRSGVRSVMIVDNEDVEDTNICRTLYGKSDVGRRKVDALAEHLHAIRDGLEVDARHADLTTVSDAEFGRWIDGCDLVIAATDHPPTQLRTSALAYPKVPTVFPGVYAKGTGGEVIWTLPNITPCYSCILGALAKTQGPSRGNSDYGIATGQLASEPALGLDVLHVTVCATKISLALLLRDTSAAAARILDPAKSVLFVGNAVDWIWREPFETVWGRAVRRTDCMCRLTGGASTADLLDDDAGEPQ